MLQYLHVKNLALIDEIEVEFGRGTEHINRRDRCREVNHSRLGQSCSWRKIHERHSSPGSEIRIGGADIFSGK